VGTKDTPTVDVPAAIPNRANQFSTRELLIAFTGLAGILGGYKTAGLFAASCIAFAFGVLLIVRGRLTKRTWISEIGLVLTVPAICILGLAIALWQVFRIGPIYSTDSYPYGVKSMLEIANTEVSNAKVYNLGGFMDREYVWRLTLSAEQVDKIVPEYRLMPVLADKVPTTCWEAFPYWWRPTPNADCRYWSTANFPATGRGPDGDYYFVMYDSQNRWFYVWLKSNF
jgi:hypothetical protein